MLGLLLYATVTIVRANNIITFPISEHTNKRCEFEVTPSRLRDSLIGRTMLQKFGVRAQLNSEAEPAALKAFNLSFVYAMNLAESLTVRSRPDSAGWRLEILSARTEWPLYRAYLTDPEIRHWTTRRQGGLPSLGVTWAGRDARVRHFLSVENEPQARRYTLGVDVPCPLLRRFSSGALSETVAADQGWLCRVPVLTFNRRP